MTTFDKREKAFEAKFAFDQETTFKIGARRNKLLGLWAAELMGVSGADAEAYAKEVVLSDFERPGDEDVLEKVLRDFEEKGVDKDANKIRVHMDGLIAEARTQIMNE